ncbi:MAG: metal dependent phosphohydrolase, partial [Pseudonocardiales bacterium]|nr:metal dependent phosphohydrolase [Pseudonocardiales bacterium]
MQGVWYAAVGAIFVLGLLFLYGLSRRGGSVGPARSARHLGNTSATDSTGDASSPAEVEALAASSRRLAEAEAVSIRHVAQTEADATRRAAEAEVARLIDQHRRTEQDLAAHSTRLDSTEARLEAQAARLDAESADLERAVAQLADRQRDLDAARTELTARAAELATQEADRVRELERIAGLSSEQAKVELLTSVEATARRDAAILVRTIENDARAEGTDRARAIVAEAVQRVASEQTTETVVSVLHLPADEMKGRIIGREGRNIRAFESVTGVNVIIDDTPEAVLLSCFDPVRREIGRLTLEKLILDGRIHPQRIEDVFEQSKAEVDELCLRAARDALVEVGIGDLDERLLPTVGRLKYRTSYGQNVLGHLLETAHIAGVMAAELGIEPTLVKRCAFLHDIGKALTHELEGSHAIIGAELLRRYGESEAVAHAVEAHHNEVQPRTIEAVLTQASDTCSAARPGARRESLESYVKRLARIEEIASARPGVEKVFAMQAGREVRVMV